MKLRTGSEGSHDSDALDEQLKRASFECRVQFAIVFKLAQGNLERVDSVLIETLAGDRLCEERWNEIVEG